MLNIVRPSALLFLATLALATLALEPGAARAHAFLKVASPAVGGSVVASPPSVSIEFTETVEPSFSTIVVQDAGGARVDKNDVHTAGDARHLAVGLGTLPPGTYKVIWHATSTDTHKTSGTFTFTVKP